MSFTVRDECSVSVRHREVYAVGLRFHAITAFRAEGVQTALVLFRRPAYPFHWRNCSSQKSAAVVSGALIVYRQGQLPTITRIGCTLTISERFGSSQPGNFIDHSSLLNVPRLGMSRTSME